MGPGEDPRGSAAHTFLGTDAAAILFAEASLDSRDLTRVGSILNDYMSDFKEVENRTPELSDKTRHRVLLLIRDSALSKVGASRWRNPRVVTFLRNVIKTRFTQYVRGSK